MAQRGVLDWKADKILALCVIVLWGCGRVINPITHAVLDNYGSIGPVLAVFELIYVILHVLLLGYVCMLLAGFVRRHGFGKSWGNWGELALYLYVLATLLLSLYFLAYEFGYLPDYLQSLVPLLN